MNDSKAALAAAMAGGYLLGRTKKAKLAFAVGSYLAGRRLGLSPGQVLSQGLSRLQLAPQFQELSDQVRGELLTAGRTAVTAAANRRLTGLAETLRDRTDALNGGGGGRRDDGAQEPEDEYDEYDEYDDHDEYDEYDATDEAEYFDDEEEEEDREPAPAPPRKAPPRKAAPGGKPPAKKAAAKKAVPSGNRRGGGSG
ncbi:hypothetical protein [Streptomyces flaveolus]|uniref:hypothetical protein n=1 Tax=Streptomyces flaveolus TaxID=67297 RepID=UPI0016715E01|nr:hypothetical protein [Streptomyces flaveolus]GGQ84357.1 hypothetical protein GCM10010216_52910 [Streptomyces flaveolus]